MEVRLFLAVSEGFIQAKAHVVYELSKQLQLHFAAMSFDEQVEHLEIGLLMRLRRPEYDEKWYKPKRPTYVESKDVKSKLTGEVSYIRRQLRIEVALDEEAIGHFINGSELQSELFLLDFLASQFGQIKLPSAVKAFDSNAFVKELRKVRSLIQDTAAANTGLVK
jgi:hypothetical protein